MTGLRAVALAALLAAASCAALAAAGVTSASAAREAPDVSARSAIVVDARDGFVLYRHGERRRRPIASATKLMTALLSLERFALERRLVASPYRAAVGESRIDLRAGERLSVRDLLRALLLESANDAAVTLAVRAAGSLRGFVRRMNARAKALRLSGTHYSNPIGFENPRNYSTALDLSLLARKLLRDEVFAAIVDRPSARLRTGARPRVVVNRNRLVGRVPWIDGVKTGHTAAAGYVLIGSGRRKGVQLVSVVLGAASEAQRDADTLALLGHGFASYRRARPVRRGATLARAKVEFFGDREVRLVAPRSVRVALRAGQRVRRRVRAPTELQGPIAVGTRAGSVTVFRDGRRVSTVPLVTASDVPAAGAARKIFHGLATPGALTLAAVVAVIATAERRRRMRKGGTARRRVIT